jgi:anti-sigma regulatory factor (Ser/Thr protein kinase)
MNEIHKIGGTKASVYFWGPEPKHKNVLQFYSLKKTKGLEEDQVFEEIARKLQLKQSLNKAAYKIVYYAFSEMLNNAIDHSDSKTVQVKLKIKDGNCFFVIKDYGIGIFNRLKKGFKLSNDYEAIEHLFKGKQTTFPERHSGQGIFFTSRIADLLEIRSIVRNPHAKLLSHILNEEALRALF